MKKFSNIITIIILVIVLVLIGIVSYGYYKKETMEVKNPIVTMEVENYGTIKLELYPEMASNTVNNFITLANNGFYDGLKFHRIVKDFMIQGGDKKGDGTGSPSLSDLGIEVSEADDKDYCIPGEFLLNDYNNTLKHEEGVISMARADYTSYSSSLAKESYNSGGSQFFIMTKANKSLDGQYAAFGKVIEGMDIVHNIENAELKKEEPKEGESSSSSEQSTPATDIIIKSVKVETFGIKYDKPKTLDTWNYNEWVYKTYGIDLNSYGK